MKLIFKQISVSTLALLTLGSYTFTLAQTAPTPPTQQNSANSLTPIVTAPDVKTVRKASWQGKKVALKGRDVVSYFENDKPLKGSKKYVADWDNTKWQFSSEKNRDLFLRDPKKYIPEFGGFCPVALADNKAKIGHTGQYAVINEKLYLNYNKSSKSLFTKNPDNFLVRAQLNF